MKRLLLFLSILLAACAPLPAAISYPAKNITGEFTSEQAASLFPDDVLPIAKVDGLQDELDGKAAADLSGLAQVTALAPFGSTPATLWVDTAGNDATAVRGRKDKPYASPVAAATASQIGDTIQLNAGTYTVSTSVTLKNGVKLLGSGRTNTSISLASAANTWVVRNDDPVGGNTDITIRDLTVDGNNVGQTAEWDFGQAIFLNGVTRLTVQNIRIKNPRRFGLHAPGTTDGIIRDIYFDYNAGAHESGGYGPNMDGVHLNAPTNVLVENLYGTTYDDVCYAGTGEDPITAGLPTGPYAWRTGPARNVTIRNIVSYGGFQGVRLQDGNETGSAGNYNILIDGITGTFSHAVVCLSANAPTVDSDGITIRNISATSVRPVIQLERLVRNLLVEDCKFTGLTGSLTIFRAENRVLGPPARGLGGDFVNFTARNIYVDSGAYPVTLIDARSVNSKLTSAKFVNCTLRSTTPGTTGKLVLVDNSAPIGVLEFEGCTVVNQWRPLDVASAIGGEIKLTNCTFDGGSAATAYVAVYNGALNFGALSMRGCRVTGYVGAVGFTSTTATTLSFFERGGIYSISGSAEFPIPGGAGGSGTWRFNSENARTDLLTKITPTSGDIARTNQAGYSSAPYYYTGSAWISVGALAGTNVANTPAGAIAATMVQAALNELDTEKAALVGILDIEITDTTKGLILKSPDGSRFRLSVSDIGVLTATEL